jgi:cytoskeletal protein CcmA (bactofilin family)
MFRRKKVELEEDKPAMETNDDLGIPGKLGTRPGATPLGTSKPPVMPARIPEPPRNEARPAIEIPKRPDMPSVTMPSATSTTPAPTPAPAARRSETEHRKLIVGREIALSGEITSCDRLVVEGSVEANLANCRDIDIAESGLFKGSASIDDAEIRGRFEGTLTVRKRLHIRATGKVIGTVRYSQIEIECGGQLTGDVQMLAASESPSLVPSLAPALAKVPA